MEENRGKIDFNHFLICFEGRFKEKKPYWKQTKCHRIGIL